MRIATNGITLNVEEQGGERADDTPTLVLLHYWGGSAQTWRHVTTALAPRHHTVAIDHRGWGGSDAAPDGRGPAEGYALADMAADAEGVIAALGLRRFVLVGHSMGGKVAQLMASRRPAGLAGLILVAPSPPSPLALPAEARAGMAGAYANRDSIAAILDGVLTATPLSPADRERVIADSLRGAPAAKRAWPHATSQEDITPLVGAITTPTLVISGEQDRVDPPAVLRSRLLPHLPQATLYLLPGVGHLPMLEAPKALANLIAGFCADLARPDPLASVPHPRDPGAQG